MTFAKARPAQMIFINTSIIIQLWHGAFPPLALWVIFILLLVLCMSLGKLVSDNQQLLTSFDMTIVCLQYYSRKHY
jgi:hypothetical protein